MTKAVEQLVQDFEERRLTRRELVGALAALLGGATSTSAAQTSAVARAETINHVSIAVSDVERSAEFYQSLLDLEVVSRPGNGGINLGLGSSFLGLYALPDPGRAHHFCLGVDGYDADRLAERLRRAGLEPSVDRSPLNRTTGGDQLYFTDPDGTVVQLCENGYQG